MVRIVERRSDEARRGRRRRPPPGPAGLRLLPGAAAPHGTAVGCLRTVGTLVGWVERHSRETHTALNTLRNSRLGRRCVSLSRNPACTAVGLAQSFRFVLSWIERVHVGHARACSECFPEVERAAMLAQEI